MPRVSVILPIYNGETWLEEAIGSILAQTFRDFELLLVDDGSTDGSAEIERRASAGDARVRVVEHAHSGIVGALNAGLAAARGELLARMDADDFSEPERFARQVAYLDARPECVVVGTAMLVVDPEGAPMYVQETEPDHDRLLRGLLWLDRTVKSGLAHPSVMMRREAVLAVRGYRAEYEWVEDIDLWLRLAERGRLANLPEVLLRYRVHEKSVCHRRHALQQQRHGELAAAACARLGLPEPVVTAAAAEAGEHALSPREIYLGWARLSSQGGHRRTGLKYAWRALTRWPGTATLWALSDALLGIGRTDVLKGWYGRLAR